MATARPRGQKRPSGLVVVLAFAIAVAATVALVVMAVLLRGGNDAPPATPTPVVDLAGIPQQGKVLGSPDANVTLIEYADLQCPACRYYAEEVFPSVVNEYVRPGKVKTEFRGYPFLGSDSLKAQRFLLAAALQGKLWQLEEALYRNQGSENAGWVTDDLVRRLASEIPGLDVDRLFTDAESDAITREAETAKDEAEAAGIPGTPSFFIQIGNEEPYYIQVGLDLPQLRAALDDALAG
jgi:protein-disulfide isomerase